MRNRTPEKPEDNSISLIRNSFHILCSEFPSLSMSITLCDTSSHLHVSDSTGQEHLISLEELLHDTRHAIYDIMFTIKEVMKLYDA